MTNTSDQGRVVTVAVDAMGGDRGASAALAAIAASRAACVRHVVFGDQDILSAELARLGHGDAIDAGALEIRGCESVVAMADRPREALRRGRGSSMSLALDAVAAGEADVAVSSGNTAALMTLASLRLRDAAAATRPAIAALWPSLSASGSTVMLDMGADLRADAAALAQYAAMGAVYAEAALDLAAPRIALLNVGTEPTKGRPELREAAERIALLVETGRLPARFVGFVEGDDIPRDVADVIVTDGFSGNVALKSAEGAARLIASFMREAFSGSLLGRLGALAAYPALKRLKARMDPRNVNGGVFLGLSGLVVKSHGAADAVAFASALRLAQRLARFDLAPRIAARLAQLDAPPLDLAGRMDAAGGAATTRAL